jgi:hypothetical protein
MLGGTAYDSSTNIRLIGAISFFTGAALRDYLSQKYGPPRDQGVGMIEHWDAVPIEYELPRARISRRSLETVLEDGKTKTSQGLLLFTCILSQCIIRSRVLGRERRYAVWKSN